jgi:hypothetical protein
MHPSTVGGAGWAPHRPTWLTPPAKGLEARQLEARQLETGQTYRSCTEAIPHPRPDTPPPRRSLPDGGSPANTALARLIGLGVSGDPVVPIGAEHRASIGDPPAPGHPQTRPGPVPPGSSALGRPRAAFAGVINGTARGPVSGQTSTTPRWRQSGGRRSKAQWRSPLDWRRGPPLAPIRLNGAGPLRAGRPPAPAGGAPGTQCGRGR